MMLIDGVLRWYRQIFARAPLAPLHRHVLNMSLRGLGVLNAEGPGATGEAWLMRYFARHHPLRTIIDVGANLDVLGAMEFPQATILACEPHPVTVKRLQKMYPQRNFPRVRVLPVALSNRAGHHKLWDFADDAPLKPTQPTSTLASLHRDVIEDLHHQKAKGYDVEVTTVDRLVTTYHLPQIDLLKIDTEGHEYRVLQGARKTIAAQRVNFILFEMNEMSVYQHVFLRDFLLLLPEYDFYRLLPNGILRLAPYRPLTHEIFGFQNIFCVRQGISI